MKKYMLAFLVAVLISAVVIGGVIWLSDFLSGGTNHYPYEGFQVGYLFMGAAIGAIGMLLTFAVGAPIATYLAKRQSLNIKNAILLCGAMAFLILGVIYWLASPDSKPLQTSTLLTLVPLAIVPIICGLVYFKMVAIPKYSTPVST